MLLVFELPAGIWRVKLARNGAMDETASNHAGGDLMKPACSRRETVAGTLAPSRRGMSQLGSQRLNRCDYVRKIR